MPFNPTVTKSGFGLNLGTFSSLAKNAPLVGSIVSNLSSVGKAVGIKIQPKSPATLIRERIAMATPLMEAAKVGNDLAWEKLWVASGRPLPVRRADSVARVGDTKTTKFFGWPRVGEQLTAMLREVEQARGSLPTPSGNNTQAVQSVSVAAVLGTSTTAQSSPGAFGLTGTPLALGGSPIGSATTEQLKAQSGNYVVLGVMILAALYVLKQRG